jgi:3-methyladenine DNA glycosylase AlkD
MYKKLNEILEKEKNPAKAKILQKFFKTGPKEYGEGDIFLGITVPVQRKIAKEFENLSLKDIQELLNSNIHEKRFIALLILIKQYNKHEKEKNENLKKEIFEFYLKNTKNINNWDLVDISAPNIVGNYLLGKDKARLYNLARSENLWERRISVISTFSFIKNNEFNDGLKISEILLSDKQDLIHKAVGWMLREIGKKNSLILENFLKKHYRNMPRTMLRYAIEKFFFEKRKMYLNNEI